MASDQFKQMGKQWLRERADGLNQSASKARAAYTKGPMLRVCDQVADAYDEAARVLTDAATALDIEDEGVE